MAGAAQANKGLLNTISFTRAKLEQMVSKLLFATNLEVNRILFRIDSLEYKNTNIHVYFKIVLVIQVVLKISIRKFDLIFSL